MIFVSVLHFFAAPLYFNFLQYFISIHLNQINTTGKLLLQFIYVFKLIIYVLVKIKKHSYVKFISSCILRGPGLRGHMYDKKYLGNTVYQETERIMLLVSVLSSRFSRMKHEN